MINALKAYTIINERYITEKTNKLNEKYNIITLNVKNNTNKIEIKKIIDAYQSGKPFKDIVKHHTMHIEKQIIEEALQETDGNITKTAEKLGLSRKGLQLKLKELGMFSNRGQKDD